MTWYKQKIATSFLWTKVVEERPRNYRYKVSNIIGGHRITRGRKYKQVMVVDKMKPRRQNGGVSTGSTGSDNDDMMNSKI